MTGRQIPEARRRPIGVIGAALDLGSGRRGVDMGPSAIRYAQLGERIEELGLSIHDHGNVRTGMVEALDQGDPSARYWSAIKRTCEELADHVAATVSEGEMPLVLGGDHSIAIGTLGGLARVHGVPGGVVWLDAHTDINSPTTSPSGNVHGMPLAVALGLAGDPRFESSAWPLPMIREEHTALVGIRSVDAGERNRLASLGVSVFTMEDVDRHGMRQVMEDAIAAVSSAAFVHVSLDMDVLDPDQAPGVGTPVRGGITYREAHLAMEMLATSGVVSSIEVVEVNPVLDERNATAGLAVELVLSGLGARIL
ncbi:MAG TPA: arginase [Gaiellales bacterium]|nr:arginase [Gaiellales bacterium]